MKAVASFVFGCCFLFSMGGQSHADTDMDVLTAMDGLSLDLDMPVVLSAARLRQSQLDTPASVTVIHGDTIDALGIKNIEEIFRLVPGMLVGYHSAYGEKAPSVSYHGTQAAEHRRLQVLIDGRSVFKPGLARVEWFDIPLAIEDIERIEVIRGPNSATYGANSFMGTINIISKHPSSDQGAVVKLRAGNRGVRDSYVNTSWSLSDTDVRWTFTSKKKTGFDVEADGKTRNPDDSDAVLSLLRTATRVSSKINMEWQFGYKTGSNQYPRAIDDRLIIYRENPDITATDAFVWSRFNFDFSDRQQGQLQVYRQNHRRDQAWQACLTDMASAFYGVEQPCGELNKNLDETKTELEYQHTSVWSEQFRSVWGVRLRKDELDSETFNDGYADNENYSTFFSGEYRASDALVVNAGAMYEQDELNDAYLSPRLAANYHLSPNQVIRFVYSKAIRSPDIFEKEGQVIYTLADSSMSGHGDDPFVYPVGTATGQVGNETISSHEISYFALLPSLSAQLDIKLFYDELRNLISQSLDHDPDKPLTSDNRINQKGTEGQLNWHISNRHQVLLSMAYLDTDDHLSGNNNRIQSESGLSAERSGSFAWIGSFNHHLKVGMAFYQVEEWNPYRDGSDEGYTFQRLDAHIAKDLKLHSQLDVSLQASIQYRLDDDPLLYQSNRYTDKEHYYVTAKFAF